MIQHIGMWMIQQPKLLLDHQLKAKTWYVHWMHTRLFSHKIIFFVNIFINAYKIIKYVLVLYPLIH